MSSPSNVESTVAEGIGLVTINRPERMNALHVEDSRAMDAIFAALDDDDDVRAVIVTGAGGRAFCAGADLKAPADDGPRISFGAITGVAGPMRSLRKPFIAAVRLRDRWRVRARCRMRHHRRQHWCNVLDTGGNDRQSRRITGGSPSDAVLPHHVAMDMALTGRRITAEEGMRWGFVNYLVDDDAVLETAIDIGRTIARNSPLAIQAFKYALTTAQDSPLDTALARRFEPIEAYQKSRDYEKCWPPHVKDVRRNGRDARSHPDVRADDGKFSMTKNELNEDREQLRRALDVANIPTLLMVLTQMTGDQKWLAEPYLPTMTRGSTTTTPVTFRTTGRRKFATLRSTRS